MQDLKNEVLTEPERIIIAETYVEISNAINILGQYSSANAARQVEKLCNIKGKLELFMMLRGIENKRR